jgi:hypothetical protein
MSLITTFPNGIETVGVELEGFWDRSEMPDFEYDDLCSYCQGLIERDDDEDSMGELPDPNDLCGECVHNIYGLKEDGSVHQPRGLYDVVTGEYASSVLTSWRDLEYRVKRNYPHHVSNSTGLHVHIGCKDKALHNFSFSPTYWGILTNRLTDLVEAEAVTGRTAEWLTRRIEEGRSDDDADIYCAPNYVHQGMNSGRYYHVNYTSFHDHRTIEVRVLPMADHGPEEALRMIQEVLLATSQYWTQPVYWDTASSSVDVEDDVIVEEEENVLRKEDDRAFEVKGGVGELATIDDDSVEVALSQHGWSVETEMEARQENLYAYDISRLYPPNGHEWTADEEGTAYQEEFNRETERMIDRNRG